MNDRVRGLDLEGVSNHTGIAPLSAPLLEHAPRVLVEPESAAEDIRNALAVLAVTVMEPANKVAIAVRLNKAVAKLEGLAVVE